jgi:hypothetical protein
MFIAIDRLPCFSAFRMLHDFVHLKEGDLVNHISNPLNHKLIDMPVLTVRP